MLFIYYVIELELYRLLVDILRSIFKVFAVMYNTASCSNRHCQNEIIYFLCIWFLADTWHLLKLAINYKFLLRSFWEFYRALFIFNTKYKCKKNYWCLPKKIANKNGLRFINCWHEKNEILRKHLIKSTRAFMIIKSCGLQFCTQNW